MNIEISTKEYRDLLDILHIADVVISGHRKEEDARTKRHSARIRRSMPSQEAKVLIV